MTSIVEIRVRRFFTSEETHLCPSVTLLLKRHEDLPEAFFDNLAALIDKQVERQVERMPVTGLREMTREEIEVYQAEEPGGGS